MKKIFSLKYFPMFIFVIISSSQILLSQTDTWLPKGIGAGGGLFVPSISPHNDAEYFVPTDMGAMFHTTNSGTSWETIHFKQMVPSKKASIQYTSNPNILYAIRGWDIPIPVKSADGGINWSPLTTDPTNGEALYIFADDSRTDRLIVSDYYHIFLSKDGGNIFTEIYSTIDSAGVHIGGVFWDNDLILIGTHYGILESTDGGSTFAMNTTLSLPADERISSFSAAKESGITRLYCVSLHKNDVYGGVTAEDFRGFRAVYKTDYATGSNWIKILNGLSSDLKFFFIAGAKNNIDVVYIAGGDVNSAFPIVYKTINGGTIWTDVFKTYNNENIYTGWSGYHGDFNWWYGEYALGLDVSSTNPDVVVMTDLGYVHSTHNGGSTWYQDYVDPADQNPLNQPTPKKQSYHGNGIENTSAWWLTWLGENDIFASFTDITAVRSIDGGESWSKNYNNLDINTVYMAVEHSTNNKLYIATSDIHDMYQETRLRDKYIDYIDYGNLVPSTGDIRASSDNGENWETLHNFEMPVVWIAFDPNNANKMYASIVHSENGGIYRCDNIETNPTTWTKLSVPPRTEEHPYNIRILNDGTLVVSYSGRIDENENFTASSGIFISSDNGVTWQDRSHDDMMYWTKDIVIDPSDNTQNTWYASVNSSWGGEENDLGGLYKTTNRGVTWTNILDLFRVESCTINPSNYEEMLVTSYDEGLWSTQNLHSSPANFSQIESYPFKHPMRVFFNPYNSSKVWVTNFGNGLRVGDVSLLGNVLLQTKIFLEGAYNSNTNIMNAELTNNIPLTSPYPEDVRTVNSIPQDIVDWILIQLRETVGGDAVISKSAFLHKDGRVVADDGTTGEIKLNAPEGNYYIVIKHRNHLKVMSTNSQPFNNNSATSYNFTNRNE